MGGKGETGGYSQRVHTTYNRIRSGIVEVPSAQASIIATSIECYEVMLLANPDNTGIVWVGDSIDGCNIPLDAGASVIWPINDVAKICSRSDTADQLLHWSAGVPSV